MNFSIFFRAVFSSSKLWRRDSVSSWSSSTLLLRQLNSPATSLLNFFFDFLDFCPSSFKLNVEGGRWAGSSGRIGLPRKWTVEHLYSCIVVGHADGEQFWRLDLYVIIIGQQLIYNQKGYILVILLCFSVHFSFDLKLNFFYSLSIDVHVGSRFQTYTLYKL